MNAVTGACPSCGNHDGAVCWYCDDSPLPPEKIFQLHPAERPRPERRKPQLAIVRTEAGLTATHPKIGGSHEQ